jgi:hypothetical protein
LTVSCAAIAAADCKDAVSRNIRRVSVLGLVPDEPLACGERLRFGDSKGG